MAELNVEHMIAEIQNNIQTRDSMKARLVLDYLPKINRKTQNRILYEISRGDVQFTIPLFNYLSSAAKPRTAWPLLRSWPIVFIFKVIYNLINSYRKKMEITP